MLQKLIVRKLKKNQLIQIKMKNKKKKKNKKKDKKI